MAKSSVLDEAIASSKPVVKGNRVDRCLAGLNDIPEMHQPDKDSDDKRPPFEKLLDILGDEDRWGHRQVAGIIRHVCDHYKVEHEGVNGDNVSSWRNAQAER